MSDITSGYRGSAVTAKRVAEEIRNRWGEEEAQAYDPYTNCLTFQRWKELNYVVKKGEKSIRSMTFIEKVNEQGNKVSTYPKTVHLFYKTQVEPMINP